SFPSANAPTASMHCTAPFQGSQLGEITAWRAGATLKAMLRGGFLSSASQALFVGLRQSTITLRPLPPWVSLDPLPCARSGRQVIGWPSVHLADHSDIKKRCAGRLHDVTGENRLSCSTK